MKYWETGDICMLQNCRYAYLCHHPANFIIRLLPLLTVCNSWVRVKNILVLLMFAPFTAKRHLFQKKNCFTNTKLFISVYIRHLKLMTNLQQILWHVGSVVFVAKFSVVVTSTDTWNRKRIDRFKNNKIDPINNKMWN